ncbi:hypothetical protein OSSY52_17740 [Tepiditoga spiralis]|uniref:Thiamine diphosphokinase n=1 Tax=Tepiditoga spiralis TaxID=2108365 RepID=A0A7G1G9J4_9BACT|nr:thiamine diphosphokinase [Tepiditoga spiralis]BBE31633.1 hypothetical protein OSSY52_17740 [Tepiditoga spiralis]
MTKIVYIISGGENRSSLEFYKSMILKSKKTIACDSGIKVFKKLNIPPDYLIGDMDSSSSEDIKWAKNNNVEVLSFPSEKDELDTELGLILAKKLNAKKVVISCATGSRIDQVIGSIYLLGEYHVLNAIIEEEDLIVGTVSSKTELPSISGESWSILQLGNVLGLTLKGFKYNLENYDLNTLKPLGVSNEAIKDKVSISLKSGIVAYIRWIGRKV